MNTIHNKIEGDVRITETTQLNGMIVGETRVAAGAKLFLGGMVVGNVLLELDSAVELRGMVTGSVINDGGDLEIYGMVNGDVLRRAGKTNIHPNAVIQAGSLK
jgi:cytoskeletal protein CcmA (bactofilin family)